MTRNAFSRISKIFNRKAGRAGPAPSTVNAYQAFIDRRFPQMPTYRANGSVHDVWAPFVMHPAPVEAGDIVRTDGHGLRYNLSTTGGTEAAVDLLESRECSLLFGSSVVFGYGSSGDAATISSFLTEQTQHQWVNFGQRGSVLGGNLVVAMALLRPRYRIRNIVLYAGINELSALYLARVYCGILGNSFSTSTFFQRMNESLVSDRGVVREDTLPACWTYIGDPMSDRDAFREAMSNVLSGFALLGRAFGAPVTFVLQPLLGWHQRRLADGEKEMLALLEKHPDTPEFHKLWSFNVQACDEWYRMMLSDICAEEGVRFHDSNEMFGDGRADGRWILVDRGHLNDTGAELSATVIRDVLEDQT